MICRGSRERIAKAVKEYDLQGIMRSQEGIVTYHSDKAKVNYSKIETNHAVLYGEMGRLNLAFIYNGKKTIVPV
jgi:hypothetical protein